MQAKLLTSRKPKAKPSGAGPARSWVSEEALERLTERVVERVVAKVAERQAPPTLSPRQLERTVVKAAKEAASVAGESLEQLLSRQQDMHRQMAQMSQLLTAHQDVLVALFKELPAFTADFKGLDPWKKLAAADLAGVRRRTHVSAGTASPAEPTATPHTSNEQSEPDARTASSLWTDRVQRGEALRAAWVKDGLLVSSSVLSNQWHRTRQALDQACARGELFFVKVGKNKYYPASFVQLDADAVKQVNLALKGEDGTAKFVFWNRRHGALGGKTVAEALDEARVARVVELAQGWSEERGLVEAPST